MSLALIFALVAGTPEAEPIAPAPVAVEQEGPVSTAPVPPKASPPTLASPPTDDFGYVAWCSGAVHDYLALYDRVMPEVTRIEKAFPGPDGVEAALAVYPTLRAQAQADVEAFDAALAGADRASPRPLEAARADGVRRGRAIWTGATLASKARLAQTWMSWSPPQDCDLATKRLVMKSNLLGAALKGAEPPAAITAPGPAAEASPAADPIADLVAEPKGEDQAVLSAAAAAGLKGPK